MRKLGRYAAADADFKRALAMYQTDHGTSQRRLAEPLHGLGEVRLAQGEVQASVSYLERALELRALDEVDPTTIANTRFALARALWLDGADRRRARSLAVAARDAYERRQRPEAAEVAAWLASHSSPRRR